MPKTRALKAVIIILVGIIIAAIVLIVYFVGVRVVLL